MAAESFSVISQDRLGALRHDLRNPLSEIIGFAELLIEEAGEQKALALREGLEAICQSAHQILAEINRSLTPDTLRLTPSAPSKLKDTVHDFAGRILAASQKLSAQCDDLGETSISDDLQRISGSARRLLDQAPAAIDSFLLRATDSVSDPALAKSHVGGTKSSQAETTGAKEGGAILVVDDDEANRALLARRLRKKGYTVSLAENGRHALERLRARRFDLVLLDIVMPEMDGVEVLRQLKADPQLAHIPVLMLSAVDELSAVVRCIELGAADYLPKPFPPTILSARVQSSLANKRMSDQLRKYTEWLFGKTLFSSAVSDGGFRELKRQERTILFADIRGFTAWSERHSPEEAVTLLNRYFETAERVLADSDVIKPEYTGDEIMAIFPAAGGAVQIARALRNCMVRQLGESGLGIGIGLHTGLVIEGLMGGAEVKAYRFVGDAVNTAKRISTTARAGQVLLSESTFTLVKDSVTAETPIEMNVKGKAGSLTIWPIQ